METIEGAPNVTDEVVEVVKSIQLKTLNTDLMNLWDVLLPIVKSLAGALLLFILGIIAIRLIKKAMKKSFKKNNKVDKTVATFTLSAVDIALKMLLIVSVIATLGIEITSIVAVFGAASFAVGLALQGSLENFAGGVMLLVFKPFKVGDYIEVDNKSGVVHSMSIISTKLNTFDNKQIIIPNSVTSSSTLVNYTANDRRRVDLTIGVDYDSDIEEVRSVISEVVARNSDIYKDPKPVIGVVELGDSSVNFAVKVWVDKEQYFGTLMYLNEEIKKALDKNNISIPYPHITLVNKK